MIAGGGGFLRIRNKRQNPPHLSLSSKLDRVIVNKVKHLPKKFICTKQVTYLIISIL